jgi:hypothetical protein
LALSVLVTRWRTAIGRPGPLSEAEEFGWRPFVAASLVALALAGLSVEAVPGADLRREPGIRAVRAKADAFVSGADRARNFGAAPDLRIDASPTFRAFIRFKVNLASGDVKRVHLLLYSRNRSRAGYHVRLVEEPWRERKITFLNAPSLSIDFVRSGPLKPRSWKAVDVTSLTEELSGEEGYISLAVTTRSHNAIELASRESGLRGPRLVVERTGDRERPRRSRRAQKTTSTS